MKFRLGKKIVDLETMQKELSGHPEHVVALGSGMPEPDIGFAFPDWPQFLAFMAGRPHADSVASFNERRLKLREREREDTTEVKARLALMMQRIEDDMEALAKRTGLDRGSAELFELATTKADPLTGPIFDPAVVYLATGFTGGSLFIGYPGHPNFTWVAGLNNNVSSVRGIGALALYNATWFGGASRVFLGVFAVSNLTTVGFNNLASSALVD